MRSIPWKAHLAVYKSLSNRKARRFSVYLPPRNHLASWSYWEMNAGDVTSWTKLNLIAMTRIQCEPPSPIRWIPSSTPEFISQLYYNPSTFPHGTTTTRSNDMEIYLDLKDSACPSNSHPASSTSHVVILRMLTTIVLILKFYVKVDVTSGEWFSLA